MKILLTGLLVAVMANAQAVATRPATEVVATDKVPIYKVTVVQRTAKAINYRHRSGATKIDFRGTALMPRARGEAKVESKQGYIEIEVEFDDIAGPASQFGPEYLTYVMWAVTPEGRATNLGEVILNGSNLSKSKLDVSTELQAFGLIITAEPYYAVSQPSDVVVMENVVRADTKGKVEEIDASYELLQRGQYTFNVNRSNVRPLDMSIPLEIREAQNAVQIAQWTGADNYATESFNKATGLLKQSQDYLTRKQGKPAVMIAREAVQTAEDSRQIAIRRIDAERLENERRAAAEREAAERTRAEEARLRASEEQARAEQARLRADEEARQRAAAEEQRRLEAERAASAQAAALQAKSEADAATQRLAQQKAEAEAAIAAAQREKADLETARQAALAQQQAAQAEAERAKMAAGEADRARLAAEQDKERMRQQLLQQLNLILETRDTARGLIVNMSDVLFDTGRYTLRPAAREKLARVAGIVSAYPGLQLAVEGHTDNVGGDSYNQRLSEQRADSVRDYLTSSGVSAQSVTAKGFGKTMPVASNGTAAGRQQNRRVELVVSGEVIGTKVSEIRAITPAAR